MTEETLYILDSYGLIYRSYFAFIQRPLVNDQGENISAIFGFFRNFFNILRDYTPSIAVAAFDSRTPTFRHKMYEEYKANRDKTPQDLHDQVDIIETILKALGIPILRYDGYEADDVIATLAKCAKNQGKKVRVLSGDKDLMQLVNDTTTIMKPDKKGGWSEIDSAGVIEEWGIAPEYMLDMLALQGDTADNIPGVKGIGKKTAQKLILEYGSLDAIYEHADDLKGAMGKKMREGKENAYFSRELVQLCYEVPVETNCTTFSLKLDFASAAELLKQHGVHSIATTFEKAAGNNISKGESKNIPLEHKKQPETILPSWAKDEFLEVKENTRTHYRALLKQEELSQFIDKVLKTGFCAFDTETDSLNALESNMVGFSLSIKKGEAIYVPLKTADPMFEGNSIKKEDALTQLARIFGNPNMNIIMHNGKYDLKVLYKNGLWDHIVGKSCKGELPCAKIIDTMVAAWMIQPDRTKYNLESLSESKLGLKGTSFKDIVKKGETFCDVPLDIATDYAAEDADFTWQLWEYYEQKLKDAKLIDLFLNLEMPILPLLTLMEISGIRIEKTELEEYSVELENDLLELEKEIYEEVGHEFNIASPKQLQEVLFTERGLKPSKKTKTGYSTDTSVLENLALYDPVPKMILDYRGKAKLKSTYVDTLPLLADKNSRIHTSFAQTGAATGRLSSRDPNLQNIPIKNEQGRRIRTAFCAPEGRVLVSADYSQIELVLLAHLSEDKNLCNAFSKGSDVHKATAALIFNHETEDEVSNEERRTAKTINFGVMYGMSAFRLSNELGIPRKKAQEFISQYFTTYSGITTYMEKTIEEAQEKSFVKTIMGRKRIISGITSRNKIVASAAQRVAINTPIQGSAADIVKKAMLDIQKMLKEKFENAQLLLQVHDELIVECDKKDAEKVSQCMKETMEQSVSIKVPLKVSVEWGKRWGEFH